MLPKRLNLNGNNVGFHPQIKKLKLTRCSERANVICRLLVNLKCHWLSLVTAKSVLCNNLSQVKQFIFTQSIMLRPVNIAFMQIKYLSNRPHFLWVYRRHNPSRMLGEHEKSL